MENRNALVLFGSFVRGLFTSTTDAEKVVVIGSYFHGAERLMFN